MEESSLAAENLHMHHSAKQTSMNINHIQPSICIRMAKGDKI